MLGPMAAELCHCTSGAEANSIHRLFSSLLPELPLPHPHNPYTLVMLTATHVGFLGRPAPAAQLMVG